jgi:Ca2+-binding RTX toxin-like protein
VNVAPGGAGSSITIYGNLDSATINLGNGNDTVYVGSALETINGGGGNDVFFTGSGNTGAAINGGTGINTLEVAGGTSFAMTGNITNIATVVLNELATQSSTLVANTIANLAIFGGNGTDTIMLGAASQTVTTGTGTTTINATAAQAGALIVNNGAATLNLTTGGNATLNANDSFLTVSLAAASNLTLSAQSFITAIGSAGNDTITALAAQQTLSGGAGVDTLIGYSGFGDTFLDTTAGLNGDTIQYFGGNDLIDITNLARAGASFTYAGNATAGTLSISQAGLGVVDTITFTSGTNLSASLFHMVSDGHGGTYLG